VIRKRAEPGWLENLTLTIVRDNYHNLGPVYVNGGFDCGSQFTIRGRKEVVNRLDDGELGTGMPEGLKLANLLT